MKQSEQLSKIIINVTLGAFEVPFWRMWKQEKGHYQPNLLILQKFLKGLMKIFHIRTTIKIASKGQLGHWTGKNGYQDGVLGMLQSREIDACFMPIPIDIKDAPGNYTYIMNDESFYIASLQSRSQLYRSDVLDSVKIIEPHVWLLFLFTVIAFSMFTSKISPTWNNIVHYAFIAIDRVFGKIWPDYVSKRSFLWIFAVFITLFIACFNSAFSTNVLVNDKPRPINDLQDLLSSQRAPIFVDGESHHDLFSNGVSRVHEAVYRLATEKGTSTPVPFNVPFLWSLIEEGKVLLVANKVVRVGIPLLLSFHHDENIKKDLHVSDKPYHTSLVAYLLSPRFDQPLASEFIRRISTYSILGFESGITRLIYHKLPNQIFELFDLPELKEGRTSNAETNLDLSINSFENLNFDSMRLLFYLLILFHALSFVIFLFSKIVQIMFNYV